MTYVLDANVFIEAARRYYAFDLGTKFWERLADLAADAQVESIDRVKVELKKGKDELAKWATTSFCDAFSSTDAEDVTDSYKEIMAWVWGQTRFFDGAKADFARGADGWLVAYARIKELTVVTHEQPHPESRNKVFIPDVCEAFSVRHVDTFAMLRELGVKIA